MFSQNGLSLDQAPPISVVLRFFLAGGSFGILAGILILFFQNKIFDASSMEAVTLVHTLTLGVMLSFMFAALFQMLPVIAGVSLPSPVKKANLLQYPFVLGVITLLFAFNLSYAWLYLLASLLLGGSILYIVLVMLQNLLKIQNHSASSKGILFSLLALGMVILLALYLTGTLSGTISGIHYTHIKESHYAFGLFGWITLLIISISFQVIEMFYVTPAYPKFVSKYLPLSVLTILVISTISGLFTPVLTVGLNLLLAVILTAYALLTLKRLTERKRPLTDATVWFWRVGLTALIISMLFMSISQFTEQPTIHTLSYIFYATFALSIVFAMFYKIVPFLTWFHLNSQGYFKAPMMHEVIHPKTAKRHLYIHLATITTFIIAVFIPAFIFLAGILTILSFSWMSYQIAHAHLIYKKTQETGEKFDMGNMG